MDDRSEGCLAFVCDDMVEQPLKKGLGDTSETGKSKNRASATKNAWGRELGNLQNKEPISSGRYGVDLNQPNRFKCGWVRGAWSHASWSCPERLHVRGRPWVLAQLRGVRKDRPAGWG